MTTDRPWDRTSVPQDSMVPLTATAVLRRMRGGAQSVLMRASDGALYVVKMMGNPQGPNVLANEVLGNELACHLGLSVTKWRPITLTDDFLDRNPHCWFETHGSRERPSAGLHFASRVVGQEPCTKVYEVVSGATFARTRNREDFMAMLVLDLWANHTDNRQAVFLCADSVQGLTAVFIDHGHMFGGPWGNEQRNRGASMYLDRRVYECPELEDIFEDWLGKIRSIDEAVLIELAKAIPDGWADDDYLQRVMAQLRSRRYSLGALLERELSRPAWVRSSA